MVLVPGMARDNFDSFFKLPSEPGPANCDFTLHLLVYLERIDMRLFEKGNRAYRARPWTAAEWNNFVVRYQHIAQQYWNGRFWLVAPDDYPDLDLPTDAPTYRPSVRCRLKVEVVLNAKARRHARVRVAYLADTEQHYFRLSAKNRADDEPFHLPIAHEVGHLLGIPAPSVGIGYLTSEEGTADRCHGRSGFQADQNLALDVSLSEEHARPWRERLAEHTGTDARAWSVFPKNVPPRPLTELGVRAPV